MLLLGLTGDDLAPSKMQMTNKLFLRLDPTMSIAQIQTFYFIAGYHSHGKAVQRTDMQTELDTSRAQMGKLLSYLSKVDYRGKEGLDLINEAPSPRGRNALEYTLNARGEALYKIIIAITNAKNMADVFNAMNDFEKTFS